MKRSVRRYEVESKGALEIKDVKWNVEKKCGNEVSITGSRHYVDWMEKLGEKMT